MKTFVLGLGLATLLAPALASAEPTSKAQPAAAAAPVDLNRAGEEELVALPGIGPAKAHAIVEHRQKAPFSKVEDVMRVRGIGRGIFKRIRDRLAVSAAPAKTSAKTTPGK